MLSSRGAITTNVAMVECAGGQNTRGKDVFLLSELEKVWVTTCILVRRHLLDGKNVQVPNLGSFWMEERCLLNDTTRYRQRFYIHDVKFGMNRNFALRYGMDPIRAPLEKQGLSYVKIHMADVVSICSVPAHTAAMALKEFIMYLGEGLYCGRTFQLRFPGVAFLVIKKERFVLTVDHELQSDLYERSSRKWPSEIQERGREKLEDEQNPVSAVSSRPSSRASRLTRPPSAAHSTTTAASNASAPRPVFNPAAPKDRLFEDIAKEMTRRREMEQMHRQAAEDDARRQQRLDRAIHHYDCYVVDEDAEMASPAAHRGDTGHAFNDRPATRESVYDWAAEDDVQPTQTPPEPEVEVIEVIEDSERETENAAPARVRGKDAQLEFILRQEEAFSRPLSRHRDCTEHSSVRDLIYSTAPAAVTGTSAGVTPRSSRPPLARARRHDSVDDIIATPPQHAHPATAEALAAPQFGRKRYTEYYSTSDSVGALLKDADAVI